MTTQNVPSAASRKPQMRSLSVRKAAAKAALAASEKTGRPVDPRVKKLAESR